MSIRRNRRINLDRWDSSWEGTFLLFKTLRSDEILKLQAEGDKKKKEMLNDPENVEIAQEVMGWGVDILKEYFVSGTVFDADLVLESGKIGGQRPATKDDMGEFDYELMSELVAEVLGRLPKN